MLFVGLFAYSYAYDIGLFAYIFVKSGQKHFT